MEQGNRITPSRKGKHLNRNERILMEVFLKAGQRRLWIVEELGRDRRTIDREMKRGMVEHLNSDLTIKSVYNADRAQDAYELNATAKGPEVKLKANSTAVEFIRCYIVIKKWSPEAVAARMKQKGMEDAVCSKTIYTHIDRGEIPEVSNETLLEKRERKSSVNSRMPLRPLLSGRSMALNDKWGEEAFKVVFKSITADNGSEILDFAALGKLVFSSSARTYVYYAHPYSSWERGTNENTNRMIRRFIPKGSDISKFTCAEIQRIEDWINRYPRKILNFKTAEEMFIKDLAA